MDRRAFLKTTALAMGSALCEPAGAQAAADYHLEIAPLALEIAPRRVVQTTAYNSQAPGPLIRWPEGKPLTIDVTNRTDSPNIVHWHGLFTPSPMDGAPEEGSPLIAPGTTFRYSLAPAPAGFRWYHTHVMAGEHLNRGGYSGEFGCFYIEPRQHAGDYDAEIFLTLHDWNAYADNGGDGSPEVAYTHGTVNGRMLGHGEPVRVRQGQRVLFHILNASATLVHWMALSGHSMTVVAMDGNSLPNPRSVEAARIGVAERIDAVVAMDHPGTWVFGEIYPDLRKAGTGIVVEYEGAGSEAKWVEPREIFWDYAAFARPGAPAQIPDTIVPLTIDSKFRGEANFALWTINGKSWPHTDPIAVQRGKRYRFRIINRSTDPHPVHLHRHTFELASLSGRPVSGLHKDVVMIDPKNVTEFDFTADHPGPTLFHCHQQDHMDFGFMALLRYV